MTLCGIHLCQPGREDLQVTNSLLSPYQNIDIERGCGVSVSMNRYGTGRTQRIDTTMVNENCSIPQKMTIALYSPQTMPDSTCPIRRQLLLQSERPYGPVHDRYKHLIIPIVTNYRLRAPRTNKSVSEPT